MSLGGLTPAELAYIASEAEEVAIVPSLEMDRVRLLGGTYGPFRPPQQTRVPLWLAVTLRRRNRCRIVPPDWLTIEHLQATYDDEVQNPQFAELPLHHGIIAKSILDVAGDDVPDAEPIRRVLKDLREARQAKISQGMTALNPVHLEMTNISSLEISELRPFFQNAFSDLLTLQSLAEPPAPEDGGYMGEDLDSSSVVSSVPRGAAHAPGPPASASSRLTPSTTTAAAGSSRGRW